MSASTAQIRSTPIVATAIPASRSRRRRCVCVLPRRTFPTSVAVSRRTRSGYTTNAIRRARPASSPTHRPSHESTFLNRTCDPPPRLRPLATPSDIPERQAPLRRRRWGAFLGYRPEDRPTREQQRTRHDRCGDVGRPQQNLHFASITRKAEVPASRSVPATMQASPPPRLCFSARCGALIVAKEMFATDRVRAGPTTALLGSAVRSCQTGSIPVGFHRRGVVAMPRRLAAMCERILIGHRQPCLSPPIWSEPAHHGDPRPKRGGGQAIT